MAEKNLEDGDPSQITSFSSPKCVQNLLEPKPTDVTNEGCNNNLQKTASANFESTMQQELPAESILIDNKSNVQEISGEPIGDFVTISSELDSSGIATASVKEDACGFSSASNEVIESREAINDLITMQPSEVNTDAASQTLVGLREEVQYIPLYNVQDGVSCDPDKVSFFETRPAVLTETEQYKPHVVHRLTERQVSLRDKRQKVPAPMSRSNSMKFFRTDKTIVDTTTHIESVRVAASKFGGSINWKIRRVDTVQGSEHVIHELDRLKKEISEYKWKAEASEIGNVSLFNELERAKKLIEELKHDLERAQTEEAHTKEDLVLFQRTVHEMEEGFASDDSAMGKEEPKIIQEQHDAVLSKLKLVKDELKKVQEDYDSLLVERDIFIRKSQAALTFSKESVRQVEDLAGKSNKPKGLLDLAHVMCHDDEEQRIGTSVARDKDCFTWEKDLRKAKGLNQLNNKGSFVEELKFKLETSSNLLLKLNSGLSAYMEAKQIEEALEQGNRTHEVLLEEISLSRHELNEHMKSIDKMRDEICALKVTAASLKLELSKRKEELATMRQMEAMSSLAMSSLKVEIQMVQQELVAIQAKEKESLDRMAMLPKIVQDAAQEVDDAKFVAAKAHENLRKTMVEAEQAKIGLSATESRLQAVLKEIEATKESERLVLDALRTLEERELGVNTEEQGSPQMITLDLDEYSSLVAKSHQAEASVDEKIAAAIAQADTANVIESHNLLRLSEIYKALEERKQPLQAATEKADRATQGNLAMEQELRKWREENGQRRKAGEASKPKAQPSNAAAMIVERKGDNRGIGKEDCYASIHPLSDSSARNSPSDLASMLVKTKKTKKKLFFFPRVIMFFAKRRLRAVK